MKKSLALLLCLCLLLSLFPAALAEDTEESVPEMPPLNEESAPEMDAALRGDVSLEEAEPQSDAASEDAEPAPPEEAPVLPYRVRFLCEPADLALAVFDPAGLDETGVRFLFRPEEDGSYLLPDGRYAYDATREGYEPVYAAPFSLDGEPLEIQVTLVSLAGDPLPESETAENAAVEESDCYAELEESWPNDALLTQYVDRLFHPPVMLRGAKPELNLSAADYYVEQQLKAVVKELAAGERSSTEITVPLGEYIYSDLTPDSIFHTLFKDAAAELYWFAGQYSWGARAGNCFGCTLRVAADYQDGDDTHVNAEKVKAAGTAVANAASIVEQYSGCSDMEKLRGYKDAVCGLTDYDYSAASSGSATAGNNPWELVSVFDGDPNTKAVCEGYAKAFQYLCDQTAFGGAVNCICASGTVYWNNVGSGGSHMWNLVSLEDGRNYLIDPTGCDGDPISDARFLLYARSGSYDDTAGYVVSSGDRYSYYHNVTSAAGVPGHSSDVLDAFPASMLQLSALPYGTNEEELLLNDENFPDAAFLAVAAGFDEDGSGGLSVRERSAVTALDVSGRGLSSLAGLEHFSSLETLNCASNNLATLELSANTLLKTLNCSNNALESLSLAANTRLEELDCSNNSLSALDLSTNTYLRSLCCANNPLAALTLTKLTALSLLDCGGTELTSLDVSRCAALVRAVLEGSCSSENGNSLYLLGTEDNPDALLCCPEGMGIDTGFIALNEANFPDAAFLDCLKKFDSDKDGLLSRSERTAVQQIDCSNLGIADLTGLQYFPSLNSLNCSGNNIAVLDVSGFGNLLTLYCYQNKLTALDLSRNRSLQILNCSNNNLVTLDLRANTKLTWLNCHDAALEELKLTGLAKLKTLSCYANSLTTLDLSTNSALNTLYAYRNKLTALDLSQSTEFTELHCQQNKLSSLTLGSKSALTKLYCESNRLTAFDISGCTKLLDACASGTVSMTSSYRQVLSTSCVLRFSPNVTVTNGNDTLWTVANDFYDRDAAKALLDAKTAPESGNTEKTLFCGWYRDAACTVPVTDSDELGAAGAFAKFITMDVLNVAVQIRQETLSQKKGASDIRFVSSVPAAGSFDKVGFELTLPSHNDYLVSNHAFSAPLYDRIYASGKPYDLALLHSVGLFPDVSDSVKISLQTVTGFPAGYFADGNPYLLRVRPFLISNDGTTVFGCEKYFKLATDANGTRRAVITDSQGTPIKTH